MKSDVRKSLWVRAACVSTAVFLAALPALAQEQPSPADSATGQAFRWLNFALVFGSIAYLFAKFGGPYFRSHAEEIAGSIRQAATVHAEAERDLKAATDQLASLDLESQDMRRAAVRESAAESERIRDLARAESTKIAQSAKAEIAAAERAAQQELRAVAARLATDNAATMLRARMNGAAETALFRKFVADLGQSPS